MSERKHTVALVSHFTTWGWAADCSCGWQGPNRESMAQASRDFDLHVKAVAEEPAK